MPDLHCPNCGTQLGYKSFAIGARKAALTIDLDVNCDLTSEDEVVSVQTEEVAVELSITCWSCPWDGRIYLGDIDFDVTINGFDALSAELVKADALTNRPPEGEAAAAVPTPEPYTPDYGGPVYPRGWNKSGSASAAVAEPEQQEQREELLVGAQDVQA